MIKPVLFLLMITSAASAQDTLSLMSHTYYEPVGWTTSSVQALQTFCTNANSRVAGKHGYAIHLETIIAGDDTVEGALANTAEGKSAEEQGMEFYSIPSAISGYMRYYLPGNDTAILLVMFLKEGEVISNELFRIKGSGRQDEFLPFTFPLHVSESPDRVIIAASSGNIYGLEGREHGSFLELDELHFKGTEEEIPNGDFEKWIRHEWNEFETPYAGK